MNYKKRNLLKRACALFLVLVMCVGMLQITAFALDENEEEPQIEEPDSTSGGGASDNQELDSPEPGGDDVDDGIEPESEPEPAPEPEADEVITNPAVVNDHEPVEIPAESAPVPGDANENTTVTNTTDPVTGNETESIETDKTWGSSSESKGEFSEKEDVSEDPDESGIVDVLTGDDAEDNLDNIEDGTYTKTEEQTKTDTEVTVSGSETRTDETTRDPDGNLVSDSFELEGQQTTTVTDTDTTRTTTTEVTKETGETQVTDVEKELDGEAEYVGDKKNVSDWEKVDGSDGSEDAPNDVPSITAPADKESTATNVSGVEVTLGPGKGNTGNNKEDFEQVVTPKPKEPTATDAQEALKDLAGYELIGADGTVIGTIQADGTVSTPNGPITPEWQKVGDDWQLVINAQKKGAEEVVPGTENKVTDHTPVDPNNPDATTSDGVDPSITKGESHPEDGDWTDWEISTEILDQELNSWVEENVELDDGTTMVTYIQTGTGIRMDEYTWEAHMEEVRQMRQLVQSVKKTITVSGNENSARVIGNWRGITDNGGTLEFNSSTTKADIDKLAYFALTDGIKQSQGGYGFQKHHLFVANNRNENQMGSSGSMAQFTGPQIQSTVFLTGSSGSDYAGAWIRQLRTSSGDPIYVYCVQHGKKDVANTQYDLTNVSDAVNSGNAEFKNAINNADAHIQFIAENGYWAVGAANTDSAKGINSAADANAANGTLAKIRALLDSKDSGLHQYIDRDKKPYNGEGGGMVKYSDVIDEGMAIAVTQAALWHCMNGTEMSGDAFMQTYTQTDGNGAKKLVDVTEAEAMKALYNALISGKSNTVTTDIIEEQDIKGASISIKEKVETQEQLDKLVEDLEEQNKPALDTTGEKSTYNTDVSFTIAVVPSRIDGDVIVYVYQDGKAVASKRLDSAKDSDIDANGNVVYTISDVPLKEGTDISLKITGAQQLKSGAYLYRAEGGYDKSQSFLGLTNGNSTKNVSLEVSMDFTVNDGKQTAKADVETEARYDTWSESRTYDQDKTQKVKVTEDYTKEAAVITTVKVVDEIDTTVDRTALHWSDNAINYYSITDSGDDDDDDDDDITTTTEGDDDDDDTTTVPEDPTPLAEVPAETAPLAEVPDEETPLTEVPDEETPLEEIPDEETPLAEVPATGDDPTLLYAMSALCAASLMGLAALSLKKRQEM